MADRAYDNAMKRRAELQAELEEIDRFLELWKSFAGTEPEHEVSAPQPHIRTRVRASQMAGADQANGAEHHRARGPSRKELEPIIRSILLEAGRPMPRGPLVGALAERGFPVGGAEPSKNLGTIMWRLRDRFVNLEGRGYWPNDRSNEEAGFWVEDVTDVGQ